MQVNWSGPRCNPWAKASAHEGAGHKSISSLTWYKYELRKYDVNLLEEASAFPIDMWSDCQKASHDVFWILQ